MRRAKFRVYADIPLPKVTSFPDTPEDNIWDVTHRLVNIIKKKYRLSLTKMTDKEYKKELERQKDADIISTSDNNLVKAAPKIRKGEAFGIFLNDLLDDPKMHRKFSEAIDILKDEQPGKYTDTILKIQQMMHPADQNINVDVEIRQKQDMYNRMAEQYGYSQYAQFEEDKQNAELIESSTVIPDHPSSTFDDQIVTEAEVSTPTPTPIVVSTSNQQYNESNLSEHHPV